MSNGGGNDPPDAWRSEANLWFDVEDLFAYFRSSSRPSGIQRLAYEIYRSIWLRHGHTGRVRFLRHHAVKREFVEVEWEKLPALFGDMTRPEAAAAVPLVLTARARFRAAIGRRMSVPLKLAIRHFVGQRREAGRAFVAMIRSMVATQRAVAPEPAPPLPPEGRPDRSAPPFQANDWLLSLGSPWFNVVYVQMIAEARSRYGLKLATMVYDIIPVRRPEWCDRNLGDVFKYWLRGILPVSDVIFSISRASADDVTRYAREENIGLLSKVLRVPIGSGFTNGHPHETTEAEAAMLPPAGSYVLMVSTIEARKNHALLFRVWRRLLEENPRDEIPTLVFAGRVGWLVADLMQQIRNADFLDGKLLLMESPSDAQIGSLYRGCLFTIFPSLYEGWGLPVTESLNLGKPCIISNRTSLPEAGGTLARYFDPENTDDAYQVIRDSVLDRKGLIAWEAEVKARFRPTSWDETADTVIRATVGR